MVTIHKAEDLRQLIRLPTNVLFIILGQSEDAVALRDFAVIDETSGGNFSKVVAQVTDPSIVDDVSLDPFLRKDPVIDSAKLGGTVGKKNQAAAVVSPGDEISRTTTILAWLKGDAQ